MAPQPDAALRHYRATKALAAGVVARLLAKWAQVDETDLDDSWAAVAEDVMSLLTAGQFAAASLADSYVARVLAEQSIEAPTLAAVAPRAFAGVASDGGDLAQLLRSPLIVTKVQIAAGADGPRALAVGRVALTRIGSTQTLDSGRAATTAAVASRPSVTSYTRMTVPPTCSRCAILAGKVFHWRADFDRHPLCDCIAIPTIEHVADDLTLSPHAYFDSLSRADQDRYFTHAGAEAIRNGADIAQVVNARQGMYRASDGFQATRTGARGAVRPMPETLLQQAGDDRTAAIDLLRQHGFLR